MNTPRSLVRESAGVSSLQPRTSGIEPAALWALFTLSLRQFLRGRRMLVLGFLALLPAGLAMLLRFDEHTSSVAGIEFACLFYLIPHVLLPLTALLYGSGMILDEQEEQTLTYLLIRSLPKWSIYLTKLAATMCICAILGFVFVVVTYTTTYLGSGHFLEVFPVKMLLTFFVMTLSMITYAAVFGCLSMLVQRSMIVGIIYIAAVEGVMANLEFAVRKLSVMYYFRVLSLNWLSLDRARAEMWSINLGEAPDPLTCVLTLLFVTMVSTFVAVRIFSQREFYVKTPET